MDASPHNFRTLNVTHEWYLDGCVELHVSRCTLCMELQVNERVACMGLQLCESVSFTCMLFGMGLCVSFAEQ